MLRATSILRKAAVKPERIADRVVLPAKARQGNAAELQGEGGLSFHLALDKPSPLNDGDAVKLEDGRLVEIKAAVEPLLAITAENPLRLLKAAYLLGGNHAAVEFSTDTLYTAADHALAELVRNQGCHVANVVRPFQPDASASHSCDHDHHHHDHGHHQGHHHHHHE